MIKFLNKRNIILLSTFCLLLTTLFAPLISLAACDRSQTPVCSIDDVLKILGNIVYWMYTFFFIVAALFILIAAYSYLTAQGSPESIQKANKQILYAIIAIIIALISIGIDEFIKRFLQQSE